jgi:hypothetical protein
MTSGDSSNGAKATTPTSSSASAAKSYAPPSSSSSQTAFQSQHHVNSHYYPNGAAMMHHHHPAVQQHYHPHHTQQQQPQPQQQQQQNNQQIRRTSSDSAASSSSNGMSAAKKAGRKRAAPAGYDSNGHMSEGEFEKRAKAMTEGEDEPLTDNEKHALRNSSVTDDGRHVCGACGRTLVSQWGLDAHIKTVHGKKLFKCEHCHKAFGRRDHLVNHTNSIHTGSKECSQCGVPCQGKDGLMRHVKEHHPAAPAAFPCNVCGKKFPSEDNCRIHYQQIHGEVKCSECHMVCVGTEGLKGHVKAFHQNSGGAPGLQHQLHAPPPHHRPPVHLGNGYHHPPSAAPSLPGAHGHHIITPAARRPFIPGAPPLQPPSGGTFKCSYCSGTFLQRGTLDKHVESFHIEVQCGYCGSTFVGTESVTEHVKEAHPGHKIMYNDNEMAVCCEVCDASFKRKTAYDEHFLRMHVYRKVGADFVRMPPSASASSTTSPADVLGVLHRCTFCQSRFSDPALLSHHVSMSHADTAHAAAMAAARAAARAAAAGSAAAAAAAYENLVIDPVALEKHAIDVVPNGDMHTEDIISNSLNMLYQF